MPSWFNRIRIRRKGTESAAYAAHPVNTRCVILAVRGRCRRHTFGVHIGKAAVDAVEAC